MTVRFEEINDLSSTQVRFYSVRIGAQERTEFEKFDAYFFEKEGHRRELELIYQMIKQIGLRGAKPGFFRPEGPAFALPGKVGKNIKEANKADFGLRLYAVIANSNTVILLNGGIKTQLNPLQCPNIKDHFKHAQRCAIQLQKAMNDDLIRFTLENGMDTDDDDFALDL